MTPQTPETDVRLLAPRWMQFGGIGIVIAGFAFMIPWLMRRQLALEPVGTKESPFAPKVQTPHPNLYVYPNSEPLNLRKMEVVWKRRWRSMYGDELSPEQLSPLMAHYVLANRIGGVYNRNPLRLFANRFYEGRWTSLRRPEWNSNRPVHRWYPVRSYLSLDAGAADWLQGLPEAAKVAIRQGSPEDYARALVEARIVHLPVSAYVPEVAAEASIWLKRRAATPIPA